MHNGIRLYPGAIEVVKNLYKLKKRFVLMTNAPRPSENVEKFLLNLKMDKIFLKNILNDNQEFIKIISNDIILYSYHFDKEEIYHSYLLKPIENSLFSKLELSLQLGILESIYSSPIKDAILKISILGIFLLLVSIFFSYLLAISISNPI